MIIHQAMISSAVHGPLYGLAPSPAATSIGHPTLASVAQCEQAVFILSPIMFFTIDRSSIRATLVGFDVSV